MRHKTHPILRRTGGNMTRSRSRGSFAQISNGTALAAWVALLLVSGATAIAQVANPGDIYGPNGHGVYRKGGDDNGKPSQSDCQKESQSLLDQGKALAELDSDPAYRDNVALQKVCYNEMQSLTQQWNALKGKCPDVTGDFPFMISGKPPVPLDPNAAPDPKDGIVPDPIGNGIISGIGDFGVGALKGAVTGLAEGIAEDLLDEEGPIAFGNLATAVGHGAAEKSVDEGVEGVVIDQLKDKAVDTGKEIYNGGSESSGETNTGPQPEVRRESTPASASRNMERKALSDIMAADQRIRAAAATGDAVTMQKELQNQLAASIQAREEARKATLAKYDLEVAAQTSTDQNIADLEKQGIHLPDALAAWQQGIKQSGLPAKVVDQLQIAGYSPAQIEQLRQTIVSVTPAQIQAGLDARRNWLAADEAVRNKLKAANSAATWPEPPELGKLEALHSQIMATLQLVSATRIELTPPAGVAPEKLPKWWAVPAGSALGASLDPASEQQAASSKPLMPGTYDVYAHEAVGGANEPLPGAVRVAKGVVVSKGHPTTMPMNTGLRLQLPKDMPAPYSWFVLLSDSDSTIPFAGREDGSADSLLLPPGTYDVYWVQSKSQVGRPMLVASGIDVKAGSMSTAPIPTSSITMDVAGWVPARDANYGWWGVARAGDPANFAIPCAANAPTLYIPTGRYDVYWKQDYDHDPLLIAKGIEANENGKITVRADAGITIKIADWVPPRDSTYGRWGVVPAATQPPIRTFDNWSSKDDKLLLPPGNFDVYWKQDYDHDAMLLVPAVDVKPNAMATVGANAGIALAAADWVPPRDPTYGKWGVVPVGTQAPIKEFVNWSLKNGSLLLPPGHYDVYWQDRYNTDPFLLAANIDAVADQLVTIKARTGIRLKLPPNAPAMDKRFGFWGVVPSGQKPGTPNIRSDGQFDLPLLVPAGTYDIIWKQDYNSPIVVLKSGVTVSADATSPMELEVQPPAGPAKQ